MASRRLMADPFFSDYYVPQVYTAKGIEYVQRRTMVDVLVGHYPELKDKFYTSGKKGKVLKVRNAFRPWGKVYDQVKKKYGL